jgi:molybdate transport system ATP-binding protein
MGAVMGIEARFQLTRADFTLDVALDLPATGITALFGHSGAGKTTLLRCIAGLERAPVGRLVVDGEVWQDTGSASIDNVSRQGRGRRADVWRPTHRRPIGYVFQEASLFPHLTVAGNLRYGLKRASGAEPAMLERAIELLGIGHLLTRMPAHLSGGERSRVGIARALATNPRLLLLDEPLASLDLPRKQEILPYLERLHRELRMPLLYVSHAADEVARLADHLVVMQAGHAVASGPLAETLMRLDLPIRLGEDAGAVLAGRIGKVDADWHLARLDFAGGSLWLADHGLAVGSAVRVRVLARDVSLASEQPSPSSIQNVLAGTVDAIGDDAHPSALLVRVQVGETRLLARLTRRAAHMLGIVLGQRIWVQVKSVALLE